MSRVARAGVFVATVIGCAALTHAQETPADQAKQKKSQTTLPLDSGYSEAKTEGDAVDIVFANGIRYASGTREIRAETAIVRVDRDAYKALLEQDKGGLPTRGVIAPGPRRSLSGELIMSRLESFLQSLGTSPATATREYKDWLEPIKWIYLEGNIVVIDAGVEVLTAKSLMLPSGSVLINGRTVDAVSEGMPIEPGQAIRVIQVRGNQVVVRPSDERPDEPNAVRPTSPSDDILSRPADTLGIEPLDDPLA